MTPISGTADAVSRSTPDTTAAEVFAEQVRLLYSNADAGVGVTVIVASVLSYLQWTVISHYVVLGWLAYMVADKAGKPAGEARGHIGTSV